MKYLYILLTYLFLTNIAHAGSLEGNFSIQGSFFGSSGVLSGDVDVGSSTLSFNPALIYGVSANFVATEILAPGTYTRTHNTAGGASLTRTATIPTGKIGAYFVILHNGNEYQLYSSWNVSGDGKTFTSTNFAGNTFIGGSLNGLRGRANFVEADVIIPPPPPSPATITTTIRVDNELIVDNSLVIECNQYNGASVTATASVFVLGGAVLDRVEWYLDDQFLNTGLTTTLDLPLGSNSLKAIAIATDGVTSSTNTADLETRDTIRPDFEIQFLDNTGAVVTSAAIGAYQIHFIVTDICDPSPSVVSASAAPVMNVVEGDQITINAADDVILPTTAVEVSATAEDSAGLRKTERSILLIE